MARVNERTFEFPPDELRFNERVVEALDEARSDLFDLRGAKIFCAWINNKGGQCTAHFEYIAEDRKTVLQKTAPRDLTVGPYYDRFQFGTYGDVKLGRAELPALFLVLVINNTSSESATITARGMSQLQ